MGQPGSLWKKYNYHDYGIIAEPYFDVDSNEVYHLTDTGRRWDGYKVIVRDKVSQQDNWVNKGLVFHTTDDINNALKEGRFPDKAMITTHPQRWTDNPILWTKELVWQNTKNIIKKHFFISK